MVDPPSPPKTASGRTGSDDDGAPVEPLVALVYNELRRLAEHYLSHERAGHTLQATALVNEAWLRLADRARVDREHFLALGAQAMRRVLVDHARRRDRIKRGGGDWQRVTLSEPLTPDGSSEVDVVEIHELLERLARRDPRGARVVELRYFGGLSIDETARALGVSSGTVDNDWYAARAWLAREIEGGDGP